MYSQPITASQMNKLLFHINGLPLIKTRYIVHTAGLAPSVRKMLSPLAWNPSRAAIPVAISSRRPFTPWNREQHEWSSSSNHNSIHPRVHYICTWLWLYAPVALPGIFSRICHALSIASELYENININQHSRPANKLYVVSHLPST